jgi:hypothetical protein
MTREALEANWQWDPFKGDIPFKRPRLTPKNIRDQRKLARPGTLIHWAGKPCARGAKKTDACQHGNVTNLAIANHIENVNCLQCRRNYFGRKAAA